MGSGPVHVAKILRGGFGDALQEDWQRSGPALRGVVAGMILAIVVLMASMGAVYAWITVSGQRALEAKIEALRVELQGDIKHMGTETRGNLYEQDQVLRLELRDYRKDIDTWRSLVHMDSANLRESIIQGTAPPPLMAPTRPMTNQE